MDDIKKANELRNNLNKKIANSTPESSIDLSVLLKLNKKDMPKLNSKNSSKGISYNNNHSLNIASELNLIGENVETACEILDRYLDNASLAHLHEVKVIHGKGTGKLRQGIHQYLKTSKYVKSFSIAGYGEGDYGVTIIKLK